MTLDELTTPLTVDQVRASIYAVLEALGVKTAGWKPGSVVRAIITALAIVLAALSALTAKIARAGFLELSEGDWLTQVAYYDYGTTRQEATFATTNVTFTNEAGGEFTGPDYGVEKVVLINSTTGKTYRNTEPLHLVAYGTATIAVQAIEAGTESNAAAGQIDELETTMLGVTVTNPEAAIANDQETDAALKARCRLQSSSLSPNGPWDAYTYVALSAQRVDGTSCGITRVAVSRDSATGKVQVILASASGPVPPADVSRVHELLQTQVVPLAVTEETDSATAAPMSLTYEVWAFRSSMTAEALAVAIQRSLEDFVKSIPIGGFVKTGQTQGYVYVDAVRAAIFRARPAGEIFRALPAGEIWNVVISSLALGSVSEPIDVALTSDQIVSLATVTQAAVHWVQR